MYVGDFQRRVILRGQAKVAGVHKVLFHLAANQFAHQGFTRQRDFVHPIQPMHHHHVLAAQALQDTHQDAHQIAVENTQQLVARTRRVGQRPQDVEERAHAHLFADRRGMPHGRMVVGRKHETNAGLLQA